MRQLFFIGIVTLYMTMYSNGDPTPDGTVTSLSEQEIEQSEQWLVNLMRNFSSDYFQKIVRDVFNTRVNSPLNTFIPEFLLSYGARGQTRKNYLSAIGLPEDKAEAAKLGYQNFLAKLNKYDVQMKTKLFVQSNFTLDPYFSKVSKEVFNAEIEEIKVDEGFMDGDIITKWIHSQTNTQILSKFSLHAFGCDPNLITVNTINFKGTWKVGFDRSRTAFRDFLVDGSQIFKTNTMHARGHFKHGRIEEMQANFIELPFKSDNGNDEVSMFIIMSDSNEPYDWQDVIRKLKDLDLTKLLNGAEEEMEVSLPKFWFTSFKNLDGAFKKEQDPVFPYNQTNLSGIFESTTPSILSASTTKSAIEIDEDGLRAAQFSLFSYSTRPCDTCDDYKLNLDECRKIAKEKEEYCKKNEFARANRKPRSAAPEFNVDRPFVGVIAMKGQIFVDIFSMNMPGTTFRYRNVHNF